MRIAISTKNFSGYTGSARIIIELANGFTAQGHSVDIIGNTLNKSVVRSCGARPVEIKKNFLNKKLSRRAYMEKHLRYAGQSGHDLYIGNGDEAKQDILLLHNCVNLYYEKVHNNTVGDTVVNEVSDIHTKILKERLFQKIVANSQLMKNDISARYSIEPDLIEVVYPACDQTTFTQKNRIEDRAAFIKKMNIPSEREFIIGLLTSGDFTKRNIKSFFNIAARLPEHLRRKIHLVVLGKDRLKKFVTEIPTSFTHIEHSANPEQIMRSLDLMLYPALLEEFGLVVAETILCGTPVFSSRMVGATELFTGLHAEALCDNPDDEHFVQQLERFLEDASYRNSLKEECSQMMRGLTQNTHFAKISDIASTLKVI